MSNTLSKQNAKLIIETCCGSADDVLQSEIGGADRAELNSSLFLGGLTPSVGALDIALAHTSKIRVLTMVRPRSGGFTYTDLEFETMKKDASLLLEHGSGGIVFGFLTPEGKVDIERCKQMLEIIGDKESVFHRAIDVVPNWREAIDVLSELGITRILTSGQRARAIDGADTIRQMVEYADGRIEILPGAGINAANAREILNTTGCSQLHMSKRRSHPDLSVINNPSITFGNPNAPEEFSFEMIDGFALKDAIANII